MAQYLITIHHAVDFDPSIDEDETMGRDIDVLNKEMISAGARVFAGGLSPANSATWMKANVDGEVEMTPGPYLKTKEYVGGFWILEAPDLTQALAWGCKATVACRVPVEVREFL